MIRKIECDLENRVETGPVQFNDDWPGVFIRGDNAAYYAFMLESLMLDKHGEQAQSLAVMNNLLRLLRECRV
jgi:hypothetical protein